MHCLLVQQLYYRDTDMAGTINDINIAPSDSWVQVTTSNCIMQVKAGKVQVYRGSSPTSSGLVLCVRDFYQQSVATPLAVHVRALNGPATVAVDEA